MSKLNDRKPTRLPVVEHPKQRARKSVPEMRQDGRDRARIRSENAAAARYEAERHQLAKDIERARTRKRR